MIRLIALSADGVNRQINTWRPGWKREQGEERKERAEKGQNQHNRIEEVTKVRHFMGERKENGGWGGGIFKRAGKEMKWQHRSGRGQADETPG